MQDSPFFNSYLQFADFYVDKDPAPIVSWGLETRTRTGDVTDALRFRIYDPLWMLSRQWQLGEFKGNDAGTAMSVNCKVRSTPLLMSDVIPQPGENAMTYAGKGLPPIEPEVEQVNREITPLVRMESAAYFTDLLYDSDEFAADAKRFALINTLRSAFPLRDPESEEVASSIDTEKVRAFTKSRNTRLTRLEAAGRSAFDGYELYLALRDLQEKDKHPTGIPGKLAVRYCEWFRGRYLPTSRISSWDLKSLSYRFSAKAGDRGFEQENYGGGRLSWYSFDYAYDMKAADTALVMEIPSMPTPASYPGAPNKRLWEFEDRKVFMGNSTDMQAKGNVAFLQYATMYGNDWMVCPLSVDFGKRLEVLGIEVYDTFGVRSFIKSTAGDKDPLPATFGQKWQMFTNAPTRRDSASSASAPGLLIPPVFPRTEEGEPLEQVNLLRDEMANMVWGVETRVEDGCGSSMDAGRLAAEVGEFVEDSYQAEVEKARLSVHVGPDGRATVTSDRKADFKYVLMNSVPYNWIPFVPQHVRSEEDKKLYQGFLGGREVILRRGKMPVFYDGEYRPVRPLTSILKVRPAGVDKTGEMPLFIDEEQVQGVGTRIVKNCQRARWLCGRTFTWMGYSKQIQYTQGNSGLKFDDLEESTK